MKRNLKLDEVARLAGLGLSRADIFDCLGLAEPADKREREAIALAFTSGKRQAMAAIEETLAMLCAHGDREAIAWWRKTRG